ncbi:S-ribosylhomocysteine lyase [Candidatus Saccharibacteria bacterium]|nr:S-ribosylhomocysteine lyase [Candidatus Saccharibacteria bacterium]
MMKDAKIFENSTLDLRNLRPGLYISRLDHFGLGMFTTLDLRFVSANSELESPLSPAAIHTIEHLGSVYLFERCPERLSAVSFCPRGSRTGFRAIMYGSYEVERYCDLFVRMASFIIDWNTAIPNATPDRCGNYRDHNLLAAKSAMIKWRAVLESRDLDYDQFHYPE